MMRRILTQVVLAALLLGVAQAGCTKPATREKPVPDPLLTSKKPIEGRSRPMDGQPEREDLLPPPPPPAVDSLTLPDGKVPVARMTGVRPAP
jgi:hypothetical protein